MRWRTALIVREVEEEVIAMDRGRQVAGLGFRFLGLGFWV